MERHTIDARLEAEKIGGSHIRIVQPGDTLYAIAFVNALDVNKLAAWNKLSDTSSLVVGQRIRLTPPLNPTPAQQPSAKTPEQVSGGVKKSGADAASRSSTAIDDKSPVGEPLAQKTTRSKPVAQGGLRWRWPTIGNVVTRFDLASGQQGIDIEGRPGQAVKAAVAGEVVYVGNGLKGYGNLVIIKHSANFLSAYAHNREIFVHEGQLVAADFRIASLGQDKRQRDALHFQIRKDGQPVNPLAYLPTQ